MDSLTLDIRTLNFTVIIFSFIYSVGLFVYQTSQKKIEGLKTLALGVFLIGLGPALLGFRGQAPDWLTIVVANFFIMLGFFYLLLGISYVRGYSSRILHLLCIALVVAGALFYYFTYILPSINARVIVISAYICATCFTSAWALLRGSKDDALVPLLLMALPFFAYGLFMFMRAIISVFGATITSYMHSGPVHALTYLFCLILLVTISLSMLWLNNARLIKSIHQLSLKDPLTGLYNRRVMDELIPTMVANARFQLKPVSLMMTDIDHFKQINDELGHIVGDETIEKIAYGMTSLLPDSENVFVVRFGGDEFMVLLIDCDANSAVQYAEAIRQHVSKNVSIRLSDHLCSMSFGVAQLSESDSLDDLLANADVALYQAKHRGRNQVVLADHSG
ncbi:GGDEF domain-containing protein [Vibrio sp. JPW-9-11-11]|uniref:GGDEF domain-containing protein n=1 Tax=Vibrio sp. JPW-9-11-11 TaxID=1416532 RepID=UPI001593294E|nr:GGDEF domain-containing protein [Vibrio sp. JPW-9-11-11]NVD08217.1 GGDEF domain-containing protein [Vibrio sp. JPW-9-11-11]